MNQLQARTALQRRLERRFEGRLEAIYELEESPYPGESSPIELVVILSDEGYDQERDDKWTTDEAVRLMGYTDGRLLPSIWVASRSEFDEGSYQPASVARREGALLATGPSPKGLAPRRPLSSRRTGGPSYLSHTDPMEVRTVTREEYLALDADAPEGERWEYHDGQALSITGASPQHSDLAHNVSRELGNRLEGSDCRVRQSEQRVRIGEDYLYPDVVAFCGEGEYTDETPPSLLNPQFVAEVMELETVRRDRGWKLDAYRSLSSVEEIWFLWPTEMRLEQHVRAAEEWHSRTLVAGAAESQAFGVWTPLLELYRLVL